VLAIDDTSAFGPLAGAGGGLLLRARVDDGDTRQLIALQGQRRIEAGGDHIATAGHWRDEGPWLLLLVLPLAALSFRRGWLGLLPILCCLSPPVPAAGPTWSDLWLRPDQKALRTLDAGHAALAGTRFADPRWRAAAFYRAGQYQQTLSELAGQPGAEAHYNRGNTLAHLGRYEDAIAEYDAALLVAPTHVDARHNRDLLLRLVRAEPEPAVTEAPPSPQPGGRGESGAAGTAEGTRADAHNASDQESGEKGSEPATSSLPSVGDADAPPGQEGAERAKDGQPSETKSSVSGGGPPEEERAAQGDQLSEAGQAGTSEAQEHADQARSKTEAVRAAPFPDRDSEIAQGRVDYLLRQVPDDPAGLLRERLMLQYLRRHGQLR
jgi:Ca-activated chloride channel family protein